MRLYAEMACARPANVGPRLASLICSASTFRRLFNSQAAQQSRLEEEGSASVNKLATALRYPAVSAPLALQSGGAALSSTCFGGQCTGSTSRVNMGAIEQCPKGSVRCGRQQGWQCAVLMAWTGRHNSNSACTHSQTSLEFDNLTVTRKFPMWLVSTAASRSKLAMRQCNRNCRRCRRRKTKGRRQCRHPWQAPGTAATFRVRRARDFLPYVQKIDVCYRRPQQKWLSLP